jgi:hypothetical protein
MFSTQTGNVEDKRQLLSFDAGGSSESVSDNDGGDATLEDAAEREQEYLRQRLREELGRAPTEEELNEWLREHTEGY